MAAGDELFEFGDGDDFHDDGGVFGEHDLAESADTFIHDHFEVVGFAFHDGAEADDGVVGLFLINAATYQCLGGEGEF